MGATDHEIYKKRGRMNVQIGLLLAAFVVIVMVATVARLSTQVETQNEKSTSEAAQ